MFTIWYNRAMSDRVQYMDAAQIGGRVKELRLGRGWSLRELASRAGISHNLINVLERGEQTRPSLDKMQRIADALGVPLFELIGLDGSGDDAEAAVFLEFRRQWLLLSHTDQGLVLDFMRLLVMRAKERGQDKGVWRVLGRNDAGDGRREAVGG